MKHCGVAGIGFDTGYAVVCFFKGSGSRLPLNLTVQVLSSKLTVNQPVRLRL